MNRFVLRKRHSLRTDRVPPLARRFHSRPIDSQLPLHAGSCRSPFRERGKACIQFCSSNPDYPWSALRHKPDHRNPPPACRRARDAFWDIQFPKMTVLGDTQGPLPEDGSTPGQWRLVAYHVRRPDHCHGAQRSGTLLDRGSIRGDRLLLCGWLRICFDGRNRVPGIAIGRPFRKASARSSLGYMHRSGKSSRTVGLHRRLPTSPDHAWPYTVTEHKSPGLSP